MLTRRKFLVGLLAAPAVVKTSSLMPVRLVDWTPQVFIHTSKGTWPYQLTATEVQVRQAQAFRDLSKALYNVSDLYSRYYTSMVSHLEANLPQGEARSADRALLGLPNRRGRGPLPNSVEG